MVYGHVDTLEYCGLYPKEIVTSLDYCRASNINDWKEGTYFLDGDRLIAKVFHRETGPREEKLPEVHRRYIEVQFMAEGEEYIGYYPDLGDNGIKENCLEEKDTLYYEENHKVQEIMLPMRAGCYAIFFPEDVHRPFCQLGKPQEVKRIVVKIDINALQ